jgi:hypothetical protein
MVQDATVEKLVELQAVSRGLALVEDELARLLVNKNRYNEGSDVEFFLQAYSGGSYSSDRINRGSQRVDDVYLAIYGTIQPEKAREIFSKRAADDGFLDRFAMIAFPEPLAHFATVDRKPDREARRQYLEAGERLHETDWCRVLRLDAADSGGGSKAYARYSPEAQPEFDKWHCEEMTWVRQHPEDPLVGMRAKAPGLLARIVLTIQLVAWVSGEEVSPTEISLQSLKRGLRLMQGYLLPMWRRLQSAFGGNPELDGARKVGDLILKQKMDSIRPSDVTRLKLKGLRDRRVVLGVLDTLVTYDWLLPPLRTTTTGRPSSAYAVNPRVHQLYAGKRP